MVQLAQVRRCGDLRRTRSRRLGNSVGPLMSSKLLSSITLTCTNVKVLLGTPPMSRWGGQPKDVLALYSAVDDRDVLDLAFVNPTRQQTERGELLKCYLLGEIKPVLMRGRVPDSFEASGPKIHGALLLTTPGIGLPIARRAQAGTAVFGIVHAERECGHLNWARLVWFSSTMVRARESRWTWSSGSRDHSLRPRSGGGRWQGGRST